MLEMRAEQDPGLESHEAIDPGVSGLVAAKFSDAASSRHSRPGMEYIETFGNEQHMRLWQAMPSNDGLGSEAWIPDDDKEMVIIRDVGGNAAIIQATRPALMSTELDEPTILVEEELVRYEIDGAGQVYRDGVMLDDVHHPEQLTWLRSTIINSIAKPRPFSLSQAA